MCDGMSCVGCVFVCSLHIECFYSVKKKTNYICTAVSDMRPFNVAFQFFLHLHALRFDARLSAFLVGYIQMFSYSGV